MNIVKLSLLAGSLVLGGFSAIHANPEATESVSVRAIDKQRATWFAKQLADQAADIAYGGPIGGPGSPGTGGTIGGPVNSQPSWPDASANDWEIREAAENLYFRTTSLHHALLAYNPWDRYSERQVYDTFADTRTGWFRLRSVAPYRVIQNMWRTYNLLEDAIYGYNPTPDFP